MISRNRVARIQLKRELTQRYKPNTNRDRVSTKDELTKLRNINRDSKNKETVKQVDKKDLFKYDLERGIITVKSHKFAPHVETEPPEPSEPPVDVCAQFDTDFESNCDYISRLYLLGPYTILENYEASTTDTVQPMMVDLHPIIQPEDWETTTSGYMIDFTQSPATTSDMADEDVFIGTPQNFTLTKDLALSSIELTWDDVQNEDNYVVERSDGNNTNYVVLDTLSQNVTSYTDTNNLVLDTTYYYRVKGNNSQFDGGYATNDIIYNLSNKPAAYDQALAVYSLKERYIGANAIQGYRDADGDLLDFTGSEINDGTLKSWADANGGAARVNILYNQNSSSNHQGNQATKTYLPKIYQNSGVITDPDLNTISMYLDSIGLLGNFSVGSTWTFIFVGSQKSTGDTRMFADSGNNRLMTFNRPSASFYDGASVYQDSTTVPGIAPAIATWIHTPTQNEVFINGNSVSSAASNSRVWGNSFNVGTTSPYTNIPNAYYFEILVFDTDQSANRVEIEEFLNSEYGVY